VNFLWRIQMAENFPTAKRGVIFVGNSRAGKSTLASAGAGSNMEVIHDGSTKDTLLVPADQGFKELVQGSLKSVTEKPNFFPVRPGHNRYAIIDMPGYADSSRFQELINFHYISTMVQRL
jgi:GTP-binding protein EngB required for normal cell division